MSEFEPVPRLGRGRCGCATDECACVFASSGSITVIGTGNPDDPFQFIADAEVALTAIDTGTVDLTLTGTGSSVNPYVLSGVVTGAASDSTLYITPGVFTQTTPTGASMISMTVISGGGSGGEGGDPSSAIQGGGGGGGGMHVVTFDLPIPLDLEVTVGAGGVYVSGDGVDGGDSFVRDDTSGVYYARSSGGAGGFEGIAGGGSGVGGFGTLPGAPGGDPTVSSSALSPAGGGEGARNALGSLPATAGGNVVCRSLSGGAVGAPGAPYCGGGGGATGAAGGAGGDFGGGGGGGGGNGGGAGGAGGNGGDGFVQIVTW